MVKSTAANPYALTWIVMGSEAPGGSDIMTSLRMVTSPGLRSGLTRLVTPPSLHTASTPLGAPAAEHPHPSMRSSFCQNIGRRLTTSARTFSIGVSPVFVMVNQTSPSCFATNWVCTDPVIVSDGVAGAGLTVTLCWTVIGAAPPYLTSTTTSPETSSATRVLVTGRVTVAVAPGPTVTTWSYTAVVPRCTQPGPSCTARPAGSVTLTATPVAVVPPVLETTTVTTPGCTPS